jgi:vancomycin resistance protein YoaR
MGKGSDRWRWAASLVVVLVAGAGAAWRLWPDPPPPPSETAPPPNLVVAGASIEPSDDPVADALDQVRRYAQSPLSLKLPDGSKREMTPASLGVEIDRVRLANLVNQAFDAKSHLGKAHALARRDDPKAVLRLPVPVRIDGRRGLEALVAIKDDVDRVAVDAMVDLDKKELKKEQLGFRLDAYATLAVVEAALRRGASEVEVRGEVIAPRVLASQLGDVKFSNVLGYFETRYSRAARHKARTYNLRQAATRLDGTVLLPGEVFDFNDVVGPRDEANGYRVAPVIAQGELVDGIGGGTCQISGTLHGAAFFAGLEVLSRAPHTRPSSYIKLGMDAAVAYPSINFRVRNNLDHAVVLHETVKDGVVRAEVLGPERKRTVTFFRRIDEVLPFEEEVRETDDLAKGERVLTQRGVPGFRATVFRIVREGAYAVRTKRKDVYPPTTQIVRVGSGPDDAKGRYKSDNHPEYRADEYLVVTQGPTIKSPGKSKVEPGGGMTESRVQGKTGRAGWQEKEGMPVFVDDDDDES